LNALLAVARKNAGAVAGTIPADDGGINHVSENL
jgi:hypothetical protein